jgi:hypothetical protein
MDYYRGKELVQAHYQYEAMWVAIQGVEPSKYEPFASALNVQTLETSEPEPLAESDQEKIIAYLEKKGHGNQPRR